ncbi:phosphate ABC transporter substrate-binding protein PstS family protein [Bombilactobacillus thymidiniphilus]|uniref:Phosphate-binding protein n=1 Tax=Bombilactobacillus thymidiniphilus TaxID=2923363 RepID=A0ABY4PC18_9LACO|nr:phosphate ABC transporter substrate-binding protein PstS family protein [Bombilactobacillus thymidiniphilus]UQS83313.1 phosphate ABC transporter substrate-binding protein PstS family protein [Bombilactobacillus thymidiniphilus]
MKKYRCGLFIVLAVLCLTACSHTQAKEQTITAVGSSALQPLVEAAGEKYNHVNPASFINVQGGGSGTGLSQIQQGAVAIGNSDVFAEQKKGIKTSKLVDHRVCVVPVVPVLNKDIKVKNLSLQQLQNIFVGKITNWRQVGGPDLPIAIINRAQGSGTRMIFEQQVLQGHTGIKSPEQDSSGMVRQIVKNTPGAISYVALPYLTDDLAALKINGHAVTAHNVQTNKWPIWSYEHMYTTKNPDHLTRDFMKFILSDEFQQQDVKKMRYVPIRSMHYRQDYQGNKTKI